MKLRITTYPKRVNAIQGLVKLEFGEDLTVYPLRIVQGKNGLFLSMPQAIRKDNSWKDLFHPVNKEARQELTEAVMKVFSPEHTESMYWKRKDCPGRRAGAEPESRARETV